MAARLSNDLGIRHYKCDDHFARHLDEAAASGRKFATLAKGATHEYIFMRPDEENVSFALGIHSEEFDFVVDDIFKEEERLVVEGCCLLPRKVSSIGMPKSNIFYFVPTETFHRKKYQEDRPWAWDRLRETSNPEQAYENWMKRDAMMAKRIYSDAVSLGYWAREVDENTDFDEVYSNILNKAQKLSANQSVEDNLSDAPRP